MQETALTQFIVGLIVISEFIERHSKAKRTSLFTSAATNPMAIVTIVHDNRSIRSDFQGVSFRSKKRQYEMMPSREVRRTKSVVHSHFTRRLRY